jgi:hypothetical protein
VNEPAYATTNGVAVPYRSVSAPIIRTTALALVVTVGLAVALGAWGDQRLTLMAMTIPVAQCFAAFAAWDANRRAERRGLSAAEVTSLVPVPATIVPLLVAAPLLGIGVLASLAENDWVFFRLLLLGGIGHTASVLIVRLGVRPALLTPEEIANERRQKMMGLKIGLALGGLLAVVAIALRVFGGSA